MATRLSVIDILERLDDADSGEKSDYKGGLATYQRSQVVVG